MEEKHTMYAYIFFNKIPAIMKALTINEFKIKLYELYLEIYDRYVTSKLSYVSVNKRIIHSKAFKANLHLPAFAWNKKATLVNRFDLVDTYSVISFYIYILPLTRLAQTIVNVIKTMYYITVSILTILIDQYK